MADTKYLVARAGIWFYQRRVPKEMQELDPRKFARDSTGIAVASDKMGRKARTIVKRLNRAAEEFWQALLSERAAGAGARYETARLRARRLGFEYVPASQLAERPIAEIVDRLDRVARSDQPKQDVAALLGTEAKPRIRLSQLFDEYDQLTRASRSNHSPSQLRKWRGTMKRAVSNLTATLGRKYPHDGRKGDLFIDEISRDDALDFVDEWQDRIETENLSVRTANRDIGTLNRMFTTVDQKRRLGLSAPFAGLRIRGGFHNRRPAFKADFVRTRILAPGALDGLNAEARDAVLVMAEIGMRPSEICNLTEETIFLETAVPYIEVAPIGRQLKTENSAREIPLVGFALEAMRRNPRGFPRYRDKSDALSQLVMKYFNTHDLLPTPKHVLYSLRHTFKDRLREVGAPEEFVDRLMGHAIDKPDYGDGHSIRVKQMWLQRIAFGPIAEAA